MADPLIAAMEAVSAAVSKRSFFSRFMGEDAAQFNKTKKTYEESSLLVELQAVVQELKPLCESVKNKLNNLNDQHAIEMST